MTDMLTPEEIETFITQAREQLDAARHNILNNALDPIVGGHLQITRTFKDPATGVRVRLGVEATVTGAQWAYDDAIEFEITYVHPFTGKVVEGTEGVRDHHAE